MDHGLMQMNVIPLHYLLYLKHVYAFRSKQQDCKLHKETYQISIIA